MTSFSRSAVEARPPFPQVLSGHLRIGGRDPSGRKIDANNRFLTQNDAPWLPVMGEFHYSRYPDHLWDEELLKIKAGGVSIVSTYVFWIHHEEIEGEFDWAGRRSLRRFVKTCARRGLLAFVRCGPWAHGECRNGGLPDWLLAKGPVRQNDPVYLKYVRRYYDQIARQLQGLLWRDGGPVIGIQLENEYWAHGEGRGADHILTLKRIAREVGLDVPLYTATGWGPVRLPQDEVLPVYGGYPDGFWDREIEGWRDHYRVHYFFNHRRNDHGIGSDFRKAEYVIDNVDESRYPFLTCELGGGMQASYHRRPRVSALDIGALAYVKLGSGGNLLGYYMYHGGSNPEGKKTTLQESQATGYPNDLPVIAYDMQAPLGEFGQTRGSYHILRALHLFLQEFGSDLAPLVSVLPDQGPVRLDDTESVRWAVRVDETHGYLFVNNHQRFAQLPARKGVRFHVTLRDEELLVPESGTTIPQGAFFVWPLNMDLEGARLKYAAAQPLTRVVDDDGRPVYVFFAAGGITPEFAFDAATVKEVAASRGVVERSRERVRVFDLEPDADCAIRVETAPGGSLTVVVLSHEQGLQCWKGRFGGKERLVLSGDDLLFDDDALRVRRRGGGEASLSLFPRPRTGVRVEPCDEQDGGGESADDPVFHGERGMFAHYTLGSSAPAVDVAWEKVREADPTGPVAIGPAGVAQAPGEEAFSKASVWRISLSPDAFKGLSELFLRIHYVGDIARLYYGGRLLADDFYNGNPWEIGLKRFAPSVLSEGLEVRIVPLRRDAPIYLAREAWPSFAETSERAEILKIEAIPQREIVLRL